MQIIDSSALLQITEILSNQEYSICEPISLMMLLQFPRQL